MTEHDVPADAYGITTGPDGNIWFAELDANAIGKATLDSPPPVGPCITISETSVSVSGIASTPEQSRVTRRDGLIGDELRHL